MFRAGGNGELLRLLSREGHGQVYLLRKIRLCHVDNRYEKEKLGVDNSFKMLTESLGKTWQWLGLKGWQRNLRVDWMGHNHQILLDLISSNQGFD